MRVGSPTASTSPSRSSTTAPETTLSDWGVTGFPETFVIDRQGRVVESFVGAVNSDEDRARLRAATESALES